MSKIAMCLLRSKSARNKTLATKGTKGYTLIASCDEHNNIPRVLENENKLDVDLNEAVISTGNSFDDLTGPLLATKAPIFYSMTGTEARSWAVGRAASEVAAITAAAMLLNILNLFESRY